MLRTRLRRRFSGAALSGAPAILLIGVVVTAVEAGRGAASVPQWVGSIDEPAVAGAPLEDRALERQLRQLRADIHALGEMQGHLAGRLGTVESRPVSDPNLTAALAELGKRQARLELQLRAETADLATAATAAPTMAFDGMDVGRMVLTSLLLREATQTSGPFEEELVAFSALATNLAHTNVSLDHVDMADQIARLQPHAETGMATRRDLLRSFPSVIQAIERAQALTWWDSILAWIGFRERPLTAVREAEAALMFDDLAGAASALATLTGEPARAAEGWLRLARARLAIDDAVTGLYRSALAVGGAPTMASGAGLAALRAAAAPSQLN